MPEHINGWQRLEVDVSDGARSMGGEISVWYREFDTTEDPDGWRAFLLDPLPHLLGDGVLSRDDFHLSTTVVNHQRSLNPRIGLVSVVVDDTDSEAGMTIIKLQEPEG